MKKPFGFSKEAAPHYLGDCGLYFNRIAFDNGYAVSIVSHAHSYGGNDGLFEIAVLNAEDDRIIYDTPITNDVLGHLDFAEVAEAVAKVKALPKRCWHCNPPAYSPLPLEEWERRTKQSAFKKLEEAFDKAQAEAEEN